MFVGLITAVTFISVKNVDKERVAVIDNSGFFKDNLQNAKAITFEFPTNVDSTNYKAKGYTGVLYSPADDSKSYRLISQKQFGLVAEGNLEQKINDALENQMLKTKYNIDIKQLDDEKRKPAKPQ